MRTKNILRLIVAWLMLPLIIVLTPILLIIEYVSEDTFILEVSTTADTYRDWYNWAFLKGRGQ